MDEAVLTPRARAKRAQISAAARALFLTQGFARTSMDAISAEAGVSKQTVYAYFAGKAELLAEIVARELSSQAVTDSATPAIVSPAQLRQALLRIGAVVTSRLMTTDALALLRLLVGEAIHLPELRPLFRQALPAQLIKGVGAVLSDAAGRGLIEVPNLEISARMLVGPLMSFVVLDGLFSTDGEPHPPSDEDLAFLVDAFLRTVTGPGAVR